MQVEKVKMFRGQIFLSVYQTEQEFYTEGGTERLPSVMKRGCEVAFAKIKHFLKTTDTYLAPRAFKG